MTEETKQFIQLHLEMLKTAMKTDGVIFGILADKKDMNNSKLCFIDKKEYLASGKVSGITASLTELNSGLLG